MKYAIIQCVNGNFKTVAEGYEDNIPGAIVTWHQTCAALWNDEATKSANVRIVDENQNVVMGKSEDIGHDEPAPEPTPEEPEA